MVVGKVKVGDAVLAQSVEPLGFASEDETLENGRLDLRGRTLEVADHHLCRLKHRVDTIREQMADSVLFYHSAHPSVE